MRIAHLGCKMVGNARGWYAPRERFDEVLAALRLYAADEADKHPKAGHSREAWLARYDEAYDVRMASWMPTVANCLAAHETARSSATRSAWHLGDWSERRAR